MLTIKDDKTKLQIHVDKVKDAEREKEAKKKNNELPRQEYEEGYRFVVQGRSGNKTLKKTKFDPQSERQPQALSERTLNTTFQGFADLNNTVVAASHDMTQESD